ncbi:FMN-dependent dehydrogenase [Aspergillus undulatus]|uniref:FMN-dependent dehydrogenase n=1 Tax=Aspergillus undulatus TaxID=1810928 RepID=UPI003CCE5406
MTRKCITAKVPDSLSKAQNLDQIAHLATLRLPKQTWSFNYAAAADHITKLLDTQIYSSTLLRPRILIDVRKCDISTTLIGHKVGLPVFASPMAMASRVHPAAEAGVTAACRDLGAMSIILNNASMSPEEIVREAGDDQVFGFQIYVQRDRRESERLLERIGKIEKI